MGAAGATGASSCRESEQLQDIRGIRMGVWDEERKKELASSSTPIGVKSRTLIVEPKIVDAPNFDGGPIVVDDRGSS